jgi:hypothetical protein
MMMLSLLSTKIPYEIFIALLVIIARQNNDFQRSKIVAANKYARLIHSLDEKSVPRLMTMEKTLRENQVYSLTHRQEEENPSGSNDFDSE